MKKKTFILVIIASLVFALIGCKKQPCNCVTTYNIPVRPYYFKTTEPYKYQGVKEYTDSFGNHIIETTDCGLLDKQ